MQSTVEPLVSSGEGASELALLGGMVPPGSLRRLAWSAGISFEGTSTDTPVLVAHGPDAGPVLCLTAAVHGDELNGIEIVRRVLHEIEPGSLSGKVVGMALNQVVMPGFAILNIAVETDMAEVAGMASGPATKAGPGLESSWDDGLSDGEE